MCNCGGAKKKSSVKISKTPATPKTTLVQSSLVNQYDTQTEYVNNMQKKINAKKIYQ